MKEGLLEPAFASNVPDTVLTYNMTRALGRFLSFLRHMDLSTKILLQEEFRSELKVKYKVIDESVLQALVGLNAGVQGILDDCVKMLEAALENKPMPTATASLEIQMVWKEPFLSFLKLFLKAEFRTKMLSRIQGSFYHALGSLIANRPIIRWISVSHG